LVFIIIGNLLLHRDYIALEPAKIVFISLRNDFRIKELKVVSG